MARNDGEKRRKLDQNTFIYHVFILYVMIYSNVNLNCIK